MPEMAYIFFWEDEVVVENHGAVIFGHLQKHVRFYFPV